MSVGLRELGSASARHRSESARDDRTAEQARRHYVVVAGRRERSRSSSGRGGCPMACLCQNWRVLKATLRGHP